MNGTGRRYGMAALDVGGKEDPLGHNAIEEILPCSVADRAIGVDKGTDGSEVRFLGTAA
jgi:hypothetical protein